LDPPQRRVADVRSRSSAGGNRATVVAERTACVRRQTQGLLVGCAVPCALLRKRAR
jgi:hypothetical protein